MNEAIEAGIPLVVIITEHVPVWDAARAVNKAKEKGKKLGNEFLAEEKVHAIRDLHGKGVKISAIVRTLGVSRSSIYKYIKQKKY